MFEVQKNSTGVTWFNKLKQSGLGDADVTVSTTKHSNGANGKSFAITFRNKIWTKFKSDYVLIGLDGSRCCFMGGDKENGYKLSEVGGGYSRYLKSTNTILTDWADKHRGDYPLQYNSDKGYWFIETERS